MAQAPALVARDGEAYGYLVVQLLLALAALEVRIDRLPLLLRPEAEAVPNEGPGAPENARKIPPSDSPCW